MLEQQVTKPQSAAEDATSPPRKEKKARKISVDEDAAGGDLEETKQARQNRGRRQPNRQEDSKQ